MKNSQSSVESVLRLFQKKLAELYDTNEIAQFIYILFEEWKGWTKSRFHLNFYEFLTNEEELRFHEALNDLYRYKPIQYIIGHVQFNELDLLVNSDVLIPRPETEELVHLIIGENAHRKFETFSVLDIGTGSGCIGLSMKKYFKYSEVALMDISDRSLGLARQNAGRNNCNIEVLQSDILNKSQWHEFQSYNMIISNPPYVLNEEKVQMHQNILNYEPHDALFVPDETPLLFYEAIAEFSFNHLIKPGLLYFEINERFGHEIKEILLKKGFERVDLFKDFKGKDRFIRAEAKTTMLDTSYWNVEH